MPQVSDLALLGVISRKEIVLRVLKKESRGTVLGNIDFVFKVGRSLKHCFLRFASFATVL